MQRADPPNGDFHAMPECSTTASVTELSVDERGAGADERDEFVAVDPTPPGPGRR